MAERGALRGQVALITGGGTGIGLGCADALARDGATVVLAARDESRLGEAAVDLRERRPGCEVIIVGCDVTDADSVRDACALAADAGRLSIVVANAGFGSASRFEDSTLDDWNSVLGTNLTGAYLTMRSALPHLIDGGGGSIVAVSSIAGVSTHRFMTSYCVSKAGLEMLVRQVADEFGDRGVRANAVRPGLVATDATDLLMSIPAVHDDYLSQIPLLRSGTTAEIGELVRFLAGPESGWITGTCISADGGHHLRRGPDLGSLFPSST